MKEGEREGGREQINGSRGVSCVCVCGRRVCPPSGVELSGAEGMPNTRSREAEEVRQTDRQLIATHSPQ